MNNNQRTQSSLLTERIKESINNQLNSRMAGHDFFLRQKEGFMGNAGENFGDLPVGNRTTAVMGIRSGTVGQ
jgi:hypothetical protein